MSRTRALAAVVVVLGVAAASGLGCGAAKPSLSFNASAGNPVVVYKTFQAIAPVYNPTVPQVVVYGDGTVIKKEDAYKLTTGMASVPDLLKDLSEDGFFGLKQDYQGKPLPGGVTATMIVNLEDKSYKVTVAPNSAPSNWHAVVGVVKGVKTTGSKEYVPEKVRLFANAEGEAQPGNVVPWPGGAQELETAAAAKNGVVLAGDAAGTAWKAIAKEGVDVSWQAGGKVYTYVYALPLLPGIQD